MKKIRETIIYATLFLRIDLDLCPFSEANLFQKSVSKINVKLSHGLFELQHFKYLSFFGNENLQINKSFSNSKFLGNKRYEISREYLSVIAKKRYEIRKWTQIFKRTKPKNKKVRN